METLVYFDLVQSELDTSLTYDLLTLGRKEHPELRKGSARRNIYLDAERAGRVDQWHLQRLLADIQQPSTILNRFHLSIGAAMAGINIYDL